MNIRIPLKNTAYNFMFGRKNQYALFSITKEWLDNQGNTEMAESLFNFRSKEDEYHIAEHCLSYEEMQARIFSGALREGYEIWGEDHDGDAYQHANEAVLDWCYEFPFSTYNPRDHI